jgi:hypothetical protein
MRRKFAVGLTILNIILAVALWAIPAASQIIPRGLFDCCEEGASDDAYCCRGCCWIWSDCDENGDCK